MIIVEDQEEVRVEIIETRGQVEIPVEKIGEVNQEKVVPREEGQVHIIEGQTEKGVIEEILVEILEVMVGIREVMKEIGQVQVEVPIIKDLIQEVMVEIDQEVEAHMGKDQVDQVQIEILIEDQILEEVHITEGRVPEGLRAEEEIVLEIVGREEDRIFILLQEVQDFQYQSIFYIILNNFLLLVLY